MNNGSDYNNLTNGIYAFNTWTGQGGGKGVPESDFGVIIQISLDDRVYQTCIGTFIQYRYVGNNWTKI